MLAFGVVLIAGLAIGFARGGSLRNVTTERLHWSALGFVAVGLQIAAQFVPRGVSAVAFALVVVSYVVVFVFAWKNQRVSGMAFVGIGAAMNFTVIAINRGMPISAYAA